MSRIASPRGTPSAVEQPDHRVEDQRDMLAPIRIRSTVPAARASAHSPSSASGSRTSWTQRGTTTGGGGTAVCVDRGTRRAGPPTRSSPSAAVRAGRLVALAGGSAVRRPVAWGTSNACNWKYEHRQDVTEPVEHPVRRRHRRRDRQAHAAGAAADAARTLRARLRRGQRRERRRRSRDHAEDRRGDVRRRRRRDHARQPHVPPPGDLPATSTRRTGSCGRPTSCASQPGHGWCVVRRRAASGSASSRCPGTCS